MSRLSAYGTICRFIAVLGLFGLLGASCGSQGDSQSVKINLGGVGQAALADAAVRDFIVRFQSVPFDGKVLDVDRDGVADSFLFPQSCSPVVVAGCGYTTGPQVITLGVLPLGFQFEITVQFRDLAGTVLYQGGTTVINQAGLATIDVVIEKVET